MNSLYKLEKNRMRKIQFNDLCKMNHDQFVIVSRPTLNSMLVEFETKTPQIYKKESTIIRKAIISMSHQEAEEKRALIGARMKVSDVLIIFDRLPSLKNVNVSSII